KGVRKLQESNPTLTYEIVDNRPNKLVDPESIDEEINVYSSDGGTITLRDYQYEAVKSAFEEKTGVLNLSTNSGKSITAIGFIQQILPYLKDNERVALFTHTRELFQQLSDNVKTSLGISDKELGTIGGGKFDIKGKQIVMVMIPTLNSALKDPKKGVKFTPKERVIKFIAEEVAPKFKKTVNTRELLRNYIKNCTLTTKVWESALEQLQYIAYDNQFTDKTAQMQLNKYIVEFDKIMEKKNKAKYKKYKETLDFLKSVRVMIPDECLVEGTLVTVEGGGWKRIEDVQEGDSIVGGQVTNLIEREVPTVTIKSPHTVLEGSMTHPTFFVRKEGREDYKKR